MSEMSFVDFRRSFVPVAGEWGPEPLIPDWLEKWYEIAFPGGIPAARNIMDSRVKKQGKTADGAAVALYMAATRDNSEIYIASNDEAQSRDRVLKAAKFAVNNGPLGAHARIFKNTIEFNNGSIIEAVPVHWQSIAGGNNRAVIFDELHAYVNEGQERFFDELVIPPTQPDGVRWIASYAGWLGESNLLKTWWDLALEGEQISFDPPIYRNDEASLIALIDTGKDAWRMPWMTEGYMREVRATERPNSYRRLFLNDWVSNESQFITRDQWKSCARTIRPFATRPEKAIFGADASTARDLTALVGCIRDKKTGIVEVPYTRVWRPVKGKFKFREGKPTIDLKQGIGAEVMRLHEEGRVAAVVADPYQLHSLMLEWERAGIRVIEFAQTAGRIEADQALYDAINTEALFHNSDRVLTEHVLNAVAKETPRGYRLDKEKTSLKIDAAVALSMAHYHARVNPIAGPLVDIPRERSKWDLAQHSAAHPSEFLIKESGLSRWKKY